MHHESVQGLIPVLATPFTASGEVDLLSLRNLVAFQVGAGADGVAVFGLASETFALTHQERRSIFAVVKSESGGLPVVAGIGTTGVHLAVAELRELAEDGARTAMVLPPYMVKPSPSHMIDFYGTVGREAVDLGMDVMVQDAPGATGVTMSTELIARLGELDGVSCVKVEAPPTVPKVAEVRLAIGDGGLSVIGGQNAQFVLDEYECGSVGTMPACEFTDLLAPILTLWNAGERSRARNDFARLLPLIVWGLQPGFAWAIHKEILVKRGIIETATVRAPARDLPARMRALLDEVAESAFVGSVSR